MTTRYGLEPTDHTRLDTQCERMLARLQARPATNVELAAISLKYTSRLSDLRQQGHRIACERKANGITLYTLLPPLESQPVQQAALTFG